MKYFSKQSNYRVVLVPGQQAERATGRPMQPGVYVKFEDGIANINDNLTDMIKMMEAHSMYGKDFIREDHQGATTIVANRLSIEPEHTTMEIKHGSVAGAVNVRPVLNLTPVQKKALNEMALEMAKQMAPALAKEIALNAIKEVKESQNQTEIKIETNINKSEDELLTSVQAPEGTGSLTDNAEQVANDKVPETAKSAN